MVNVVGSILFGLIFVGIVGGVDFIFNVLISLSFCVIYKFKFIFKVEIFDEKFCCFCDFFWGDFKLYGVNLKDFMI